MAAPRIPVVELGGGRPPTGDGARAALVNPVSQMEAQNRAKGIGTGSMEGAAKLAFALAGELKKQDVDRDQIEAVKLEGRTLASIDDEKSKLDPMDPNYAEQIKEIINRHTTGAMADARFRTREVKDETSRRLARIGAAAELTAAGDRRRSLEAESVRVYRQEVDSVNAAILKDPQGADIHMGRMQAAAERLRGSISPDKMRAEAARAADSFLIAQIEGRLERGDIGGAKTFLDQNRGSFSLDQNRALGGRIREAEAKGRADAERGRAAFLSDYQVAFGERVRRPDFNPPAEIDNIEKLYKEGKLSPAIRAAAIERVRDVQDARDKERGLEADAIRKLSLGLGFKDEKENGRAWAAYSRDKEVTPDLVSQYAAGNGALPPQVKDMFEAADKFGGANDPASETRLAQAAMFYASLSDSVPGVMRKENRARLEAVALEARLNGGTPEAFQAAAKGALARIPQTQTAIEDREKAFKAQIKPDEFTGLVNGVFSTGTFAAGAVIEGNVAEDALRITREAFVNNGGNLEAAKEVAKKQIARLYQLSYATGGRPIVTRNPIEGAFPPDYAGVSLSDRAKIVDTVIQEQLTNAKIELDKSQRSPPYKLEFVGNKARPDGTVSPMYHLYVIRKGGVGTYERVDNGPKPLEIFAPRPGSAIDSPLLKDMRERNRAEEEARRSAREAREKLQRKQ